MKSLFKPYSLLLYLLVVIAFFFLGVIYAGVTDAAKDQVLAGGAIVLGYGIISSFFALLLAFFLAYQSSRNTILTINKVLGVIVVLSLGYFIWKFYTKTQQERETQQQNTPTKPTATEAKLMTMLLDTHKKSQKKTIMGFGMFSPNMFENKALYFYGNLNLEKSLMEHIPTDSITFKKSEYGSFNIATAPPWLVPDHLKLDYDMLYFKVVSVSEDFLEVIVNTSTLQTAYIDKQSGVFKYWPEFLLSVNSVEFIGQNSQKVHVKPLDGAGFVNTNHSFMKPLKVKQSWMYVLLLNNEFETTGKGWIKWKENNQLLITYNLLS
ncbi:hypothetical protein C1T31_03940 [Hanstruepera neustonica]|uniref:Uncharacterized protein n=1 Tax=Hanstruepera neustonica TaxID=1445657 RepID=A0A2K1E4V7_9FLAO|nr:hypothetical protein [Hanstruepera neustonica]PNQ75293.1 hypothetical protein C1T31_03940 [Hanstruepera neustonica]